MKKQRLVVAQQQGSKKRPSKKAVLIVIRVLGTTTILILTILTLLFFPSTFQSYPSSFLLITKKNKNDTDRILISALNLTNYTHNSTNGSKASTTSISSSISPPVPSAAVKKACDLSTGQWVKNPEAPYYTNATCQVIHELQNCQKHGRPDSDYLKWKWKPDGCDLPVFNPAQFLEIVTNKSLAFIGDSISRNQMQSLICLLSTVEYPVDTSYKKNDQTFVRWHFTTYNFTVANFWTPHLVKSRLPNPAIYRFDLHLDEPDETWSTHVDQFDYLIVSAGQWFYGQAMFYENKDIVGCHRCQLPNVSDLTMYYGYRKAFRTAFKAINSLKNYKGITFLRTFSPGHYENGTWNQGGECARTKPFGRYETVLKDGNLEIYKTQVEELKSAERRGRKRGLKFRLLDTTRAMLLRPDGHPNRYGHWANGNRTTRNDCLHWCLPGPIDTWSDFLLEMLIMEGGT